MTYSGKLTNEKPGILCVCLFFFVNLHDRIYYVIIDIMIYSGKLINEKPWNIVCVCVCVFFFFVN